jgi:serine/threonine protein kinase
MFFVCIDFLDLIISSTSLEFLGGNTLDDSPFIVMPFMKNGNATDYIEMNPQFNRFKMVCFSHILLIHSL